MINWTGVKPDSTGIIKLKKLHQDMIPLSEENKSENSEKNIKIGILDIETNGLDVDKNYIIEIGFIVYEVNRDTGKIISKVKEYQALQEIKEPLTKKIINITNLTDEMLKGQIIDWDEVNDLLSQCSYILAHNSYFDRGFIDKRVLSSSRIIWGCSLSQIDWIGKGFQSKSLVNLCLAHGIYYDGHRAVNDVEATTYLLQQKRDDDSHCYLKQLLDEIDKPQQIVVAHKYPATKKDVLKDRGYIWAGDIWSWVRILNEDESVREELKWLENKIYEKNNTSYVVKINPVDNFKTYKHLAQVYSFKQKQSSNYSQGDYRIDVKLPKDARQLVKDRGYRWNPDDYTWWLRGDKEAIKKEVYWVKSELMKKLGENKVSIISAKKVA